MIAVLQQFPPPANGPRDMACSPGASFNRQPVSSPRRLRDNQEQKYDKQK